MRAVTPAHGRRGNVRRRVAAVPFFPPLAQQVWANAILQLSHLMDSLVMHKLAQPPNVVVPPAHKVAHLTSIMEPMAAQELFRAQALQPLPFALRDQHPQPQLSVMGFGHGVVQQAMEALAMCRVLRSLFV